MGQHQKKKFYRHVRRYISEYEACSESESDCSSCSSCSSSSCSSSSSSCCGPRCGPRCGRGRCFSGRGCCRGRRFPCYYTQFNGPLIPPPLRARPLIGGPFGRNVIGLPAVGPVRPVVPGAGAAAAGVAAAAAVRGSGVFPAAAANLNNVAAAGLPTSANLNGIAIGGNINGIPIL